MLTFIPLLTALKVLTALYSAVLFLQSGSDKVFNWSGNKAYIASVFEKTFLASISTLLLGIITILEVSAGLCAGAGVFSLMTGQGESLAASGILLGAVSILCLFSGLRIAKDYAGAAALTTYFIFFILALGLFAGLV